MSNINRSPEYEVIYFYPRELSKGAIKELKSKNEHTPAYYLFTCTKGSLMFKTVTKDKFTPMREAYESVNKNTMIFYLHFDCVHIERVGSYE